MAEIKQALLAKVVGIAQGKKFNRQGIYNAVRRGQLDANSSNLIDTLNQKNSDWLRAHGVSQQMIDQYLSEIQNQEEQKQKIKEESNQNTNIQKPKQTNKTVVDSERILKIEKVIHKNDIENDVSKSVDDVDFENITGLPAKLMDLNIKELVMRYGGPLMLDSFSKILQRLMTSHEKDQKMQERRLDLIEKDFVISNVFSYLSNLSESLFDLAESQTDVIIAAVKSDEKKARGQIRDMRLKSYSKIIKEAQKQINNSIKQLKSKHDKTEISE